MNRIIIISRNLTWSSLFTRMNLILRRTNNIGTESKIDRYSSSSMKSDMPEIDLTEKYIEERVNNLFNIILADITSWQQYNSMHNKPNAIIYQDPFNCKDQILQDLVKNNNDLLINRNNYNIHDLIEDEFQLEISDKEFEQFKTLNDIIKYVCRRWDVRQKLLALHSADYAYPSYWY